MASKSAKGQIVYLFSLMVMIFTVLGGLSVQELNKSDKTRVTDEIIENIHNACLQVFKTDVDFFAYDLNNPRFYQTSSSVYLTKHDSLISKIDSLITVAMMEENISIDSDLGNIRSIVVNYDSSFENVRAGILLKGFGKFGLEGEMRKYAEHLESVKNISKEDYHTLRNLEKDYLLSYDSAMSMKFTQTVGVLKQKYSGVAREGLQKYESAFTQLVTSTNDIGLENQLGLKGILNKRTDALIKALSTLGRKSDVATERSRKQGITILLFAVIGGAAFCVFLIILIIRKL